MKNRSTLFWGTAAAACAFLLVLIARTAVTGQTTGAGSLLITTADLRQDYTVIGIVSQYQEFAAMSFKGDPLENAIKRGQEKFAAAAKTAGADGVVGYRIEFASRTDKDEGRVLVYGTAVRFK